MPRNDNTTEIWKPVAISEFGHLYEVSNMGRIRRIARGKSTFVGRVLKPRRNGGGYVQVHLSRGRKDKYVLLAPVICTIFNGPRPPGHECNHKNGIKLDNRASNLEWLTPGDNHRHAYRIGLKFPPDIRGEAHPMHKLNAEDVLSIRARKGLVRQKDLAKEFGVTEKHIGRIQNRREWQHL